MRKNADTVFVALLLALLLGSLVKAVFFPKQINTLENRYAKTLPAVSADHYLSGKLQDDTDAALSDQLPFAEQLTSYSNRIRSRVTLTLLQWQMQADPDHYYVYDAERAASDPAAANVQFYAGRLCYAPKKPEDYSDAIAKRTEALNQLFAENEGTEFFAYFVENDANIDFESGKNCGICDAVLEALALPEEQKGAFRLTGIGDFSQRFYETDHHWNDLGVRIAYGDLAELLGFEKLSAEREFTLDNRLSGSKAKAIGAQDILTESVSVSTYDLPEYETYVNGKEGTYGNEAFFLSGRKKQTLTYGAFYGGDEGEVIFRNTALPDGGNLLIIGDSYDNALLKLLASHYSCTCAIDPRYYAQKMGSEFSLSSYLDAHDIDQVLFIGSVSFWTLDEFAVEG